MEDALVALESSSEAFVFADHDDPLCMAANSAVLAAQVAQELGRCVALHRKTHWAVVAAYRTSDEAKSELLGAIDQPGWALDVAAEMVAWEGGSGA